ncbi:tetratricopeptide repeat-containing sensor histidine kinase [Mangrovimonas sp. YM274]|uniref:tetratricopeptide repeat-containing sensor histidine kinase n=1 Tax=Mangrovimonas sp. YM274 TaxID=3070660 RepID=UPI0027DD026D|nr:tetratricopeptide repeat-containing sensor histidine kinase [Mangrovimonas sp. YM274]WMI67962.1 tetratricopeptide repeat-containing sensor histidine kinase [Mangrovimonas sp. YM274]
MKQLITLAALFSALLSYSQTREIDSLTLELAYQKQDSIKVETSLLLIKNLYKSKEYQKASMFIDQTERLSKSLNYTKGIAESVYYKALIYSQRGDYYNSIDSFNRSKRLYQQLNDTLGIAKVSNCMGLIEIKRGNYIVGLENSLSAINIFETKNLRDELSSAYNNLAEAYYKTQQIDKAIEFNLKALSVREQLQDSTGIKMSTKNIAHLYSLRREHRKAIEYYEKAMNLLNPEKDLDLKGEILPRIGEEYLRFKDYDKAAEYLVEGLKFNRRRNNKEGLIRSLNSVGKLNLEQNKTRLAEKQLDEAYALAKDGSYKLELLKNYELHKQLDSMQGQFHNAFFWQGKYYGLKEELNKQNQPKIPVNTDAIIKDEQSHAIADQEEPSSVIPALSSKNSKEVKKLKLISYVLVAAFLIALTFLMLIYLRRKSRLAYTKELEEKNKQIQMQNEAILEQSLHLEEINKVKDRLFSIVSHDLKDSVSSIKGFIDLLKEDSLSKEEFYELIPELSENANNASLLLFNLLNWSKSQMQNLEPNPELFNIQEVFQTKISLIEQKVEQKRIVLIDESQRDFIYADRSMVEIVIQNLLTNAVKFSKVGDIITVSNVDRNGKSLICVEDTGVGISPENMEKLFKNNTFTTVGTKSEKGTGLGLTICKELVELNHGKIWVESTPNVGSKFFVELPKTKPSK